MKVFNFIFCFIFIAFAALQYNDPDPYVWIPIYMYAAIMCWLAFRKKYNSYTLLLGVGIYSIYAVYKFFDENGVWDWITKHDAENITESMKANTPWVEETREFFGLVILIVVLLIDYFYSRKRLRRVH